MELSWIGWTYLAVLLAILPALALAQPPGDFVPPPRRSLYLSASTVLWVLAGVTVMVLAWEGVPPHAVGWGEGGVAHTLVWAAGATAAALLLGGLVTLAGQRLGLRESFLVTHLLPRDRGDRWAFVGVALTAGITEEWIYRGYALWALSEWWGGRAWAAAAVVAFAFGMLHAYQRAIGIVRATLLGFVMAVPVIAGGGLLAAMIAHAGVDLVTGLGWRRFLPEEPAPAEPAPPETESGTREDAGGPT